MELIDKAKNIQAEIDTTFTDAYKALQMANMEMGEYTVEQISRTIPEDDSIVIKTRSIMGTEIPLVEYDGDEYEPGYSFYGTTLSLDRTCAKFTRVKELTIRLSMVETSAYRLANSIKKTQKRANALQNITIPMYEDLTTTITNALEEKEREEFTRLKVIKKFKDKK